MMQYSSQKAVHILRIMTMDDPPGNPVFLCCFQVINIGQAADIFPHGVPFGSMVSEEFVQLLPKSRAIALASFYIKGTGAQRKQFFLIGNWCSLVSQKIQLYFLPVHMPVVRQHKTLHPTGIRCQPHHQYSYHFSRSLYPIPILFFNPVPP